MKNTLISIIIPAFNEERKIRNCLNSIFAQTYKNLEVFVVDDGSSDNTMNIVREFKSIKLLQQNHRGPGAAKNLAAEQSKGKIFVFVDSDEILDKDYVKKMVSPIINDESLATIGVYRFRKPKNVWVRCMHNTANDLVFHGGLKIFRAISRKKFYELGRFNPKKGYSDDRLDVKTRISRVPDALFYHDVDDRISEVYKKAHWVGKSLIAAPKRPRFFIGLTVLLAWLFFLVFYVINLNLNLLSILIALPVFYLLFLAVKKTLHYNDLRMLYLNPLFRIIYTFGMFTGLIRNIIDRLK